MKRIIFTCLLGIGLLLPSTTVKSNVVNVKSSKVVNFSRVISVYVEGTALLVNSDSKSGQLMYVEVYDLAGDLLLLQKCTGYTAQVDLSSLPSGSYEVEVVAQHDLHWFPISL